MRRDESGIDPWEPRGLEDNGHQTWQKNPLAPRARLPEWQAPTPAWLLECSGLFLVPEPRNNLWLSRYRSFFQTGHSGSRTGPGVGSPAGTPPSHGSHSGGRCAMAVPLAMMSWKTRSFPAVSGAQIVLPGRKDLPESFPAGRTYWSPLPAGRTYWPVDGKLTRENSWANEAGEQCRWCSA